MRRCCHVTGFFIGDVLYVSDIVDAVMRLLFVSSRCCCSPLFSLKLASGSLLTGAVPARLCFVLYWSISTSHFRAPLTRASIGEDTKSYCQNLANHISKVSDIPAECKKYPDVVKELSKVIAERDAAIATKGMRSGSGNETRRALFAGSESEAQLTRRLTQTSRKFSNNKKEKKGFFS